MAACQHLDQIREVVPSSMEACSECLAAVNATPDPHRLPYSAE
jgi:hypothetical protein